jgi:photosystem II stability/assembly factor-like uncharacterized protein
MLRRGELRTVARMAGIAVALSSGPALAGINTFTPIGPDGGFVETIIIHPTQPSIAFALTGAGYYRSTDSGLTWSPIRPGLRTPPSDLAIDPSDPNRIIVAAAGEAPLLSTDAGATLASAGNFPAVAAGITEVEFSGDGSVVYAASGARIFRSTDSGRSWTERTPAQQTSSNWVPLAFLRVDPVDPNILYAFDLNQGGLRSIDGAGSWQSVPFPANSTDLAITTTTPRQLWVASMSSGVQLSTNGGASFAAAGAGALQGAFAVAIDPVDQAIVYAAIGTSSLFRTINGGAQWTDVPVNVRLGVINSIAIDRQQRTHLMLSGFAGIATTTTSGSTWQSRHAGIFAAGGLSMSRVEASGRVYVNTSNVGVHFLATGASALAPVDNEELGDLQSTTGNLSTFGLLAQARGSDRLFVGVSGGYARSNSDGDAWQSGTTGSGGPDGTVGTFADSPGNPDLILASTFPGVHRSIDGGDSWTPAENGLPSQPRATVLTFSAAAPMTVYAGIEQHGVYKSTDGGANWSPANTGFTTGDVRAIAVDPTNAQVAYATANAGGVMKTTNGGASWSPLTLPTPNFALAVALDPQAPNVVYVGGFNCIARSIDAGQTWQVLRSEDSERPYWIVQALLVDPRRAGVLLATTHSQGVVELTIAPDLVMEDVSGSVSLPTGSQAMHRFLLRNFGPYHALGAQAVVSLPAGATGISATAANGTCTTQGTTVTCTVPVLETNASSEIVVRASYSAAGTINVTANASSALPDAAVANNQVSQSVTFITPSTSSGGGGGGGTMSWLWLFALAALRVLAAPGFGRAASARRLAFGNALRNLP